MIPVLFTMWALAAPAGYLVGDVFAHKNSISKELGDVLPFVTAVFTPLAAMLALVLIMQTQLKEEDNE